MKIPDNNTSVSVEVPAEHYTNGEKVQAASVVYWEIVEIAEQKSGLEGCATSGIIATDLGQESQGDSC